MVKNFTENGISYRSILAAEFARRSEANPRYSQRAFARDLGLAASRLSEILNGKQGLSPDGADKIAGRLNVPAPYKSVFREMVIAEHARGKLQRDLASKKVNRLLPELQSQPEEFGRAFGFVDRRVQGPSLDSEANTIVEKVTSLLMSAPRDAALSQACKEVVISGHLEDGSLLPDLAREILFAILRNG